MRATFNSVASPVVSSNTVRIVKSTVPFLQAHSEAITRHFYPLLFARHPQLAEFFNMSHQAAGTQQRALADAVLAYAAHIDRPEVLASAVSRIVHRHVALGIRADHYPLVGECLLQAIKEVLGAAASDEVIGAWKEAYGALAQGLVAAEEAVYSTRERMPGGWRGERVFRVARRERESDIVTSFYLEPEDGGPLLGFTPGQYLTLVLRIEGKTVRRNYSLSDAPGKPWYRISVKREPEGHVSNWLHEHAQPGTRVHATPPSGEFVLHTGELRRPLVLVTGGVGITPAMSMLEVAGPAGRPVRFLHAARHAGVHAFRERVNELARRHPNVMAHYVYSEPRSHDTPHSTGFLTRELLAQSLPEDRDVDLYTLGPKPFMEFVLRTGLELGVPRSRLHYEFFGPTQSLAA
jgi:nitric oxide dioxygenase